MKWKGTVRPGVIPLPGPPGMWKARWAGRLELDLGFITLVMCLDAGTWKGWVSWNELLPAQPFPSLDAGQLAIRALARKMLLDALNALDAQE